MNDAAHSFLVTTVTTKHNEAKKAVDKFLRVMFASPSTEAKTAALQSAITAMDNLQSVVHENFRPAWIARLLTNLKQYAAQPTNATGINAVQLIATDNFPDMNAHQWDFAEPNAAGFDFDRIFDDARHKSQIPQLFDEIIACLQEIIDSKAIDSIKIVNELAQLISTLKNAKQGSYVATRHAWFFLVEWLKNTGWEAFGDIPILGAPVRGLKTTLEKTNTGLVNMHVEMHEKIQESTNVDLPKLEYHPPALPAPEPEPETEQGEDAT